MYTQTYVCLWIYKYICVCICMCIYYLHTHRHTHTHTHTQILQFNDHHYRISYYLQKFSYSSHFLTSSPLLLRWGKWGIIKDINKFFQIATTILFLLPCFCLIHRHMPTRLKLLKNHGRISAENNWQQEMGEVSSTCPALETVW